MVVISQIRLSNAQFSTSARLVAVFAGGTSGIGNITLGELARLRISMRAYVVGRKASEARFKTFVDELDLAPNVEFVWVEGEISLLAEVKRVCEYIRSVEDHVDLLFMTTGYAPFGGRESMVLRATYQRISPAETVKIQVKAWTSVTR
jgi:NAD(P)-dependent dehydrogenase (short-subunit alcohol dehydrogenase family)